MICDSSNMGGVSPRVRLGGGLWLQIPHWICGLGFDFAGEDFVGAPLDSAEFEAPTDASPAKAGVQLVRWRALFLWGWIPAFAGNTDLKVRFRDDRRQLVRSMFRSQFGLRHNHLCATYCVSHTVWDMGCRSDPISLRLCGWSCGGGL